MIRDREREKVFAYKLILESFTEVLQPKRMLEGTERKQCYKSDFETVAVSFTSGSYYDSEVPAKPYMLALSIYRKAQPSMVSMVNHITN